MILVDFDNTLVHNKFDVDLTGNLKQFFATWENLPNTIYNVHLVNWLRDKEFKIFTNRGEETQYKVIEFLTTHGLIDNCKGFIFCEGNKEIIRQAEQGFLIDNAKKYNPQVLLTRNTRQQDLDIQLKRWQLNA